MFGRIRSNGGRGKTAHNEARAETPIQSAIRRGDMARDQGDWDVAAAEYSVVLDMDSSLEGIWVQLGHALKEKGAQRPAIHAYEKAISLSPSQIDTHLHTAHLLKNTGQYDRAIRHFLHAFMLGLNSPNEERELLALLSAKVSSGKHQDIVDAMSDVENRVRSDAETPVIERLRKVFFGLHREGRQKAKGDTAKAGLALVFDISDLIGFWRNARLPTGIQRVQIETVMAALSSESSAQVSLCCFTAGREGWLEVPIDLFRSLCDLAVGGGRLDDPDWTETLGDLDWHLALTFPFDLPRGAVLVNLGTSWWLQNYFLYVRHAKKTRGIRYIPFVHDMIPIITPEHCTPELTQDFISWALGVFDHADFFLVNSHSTGRDLQKVANILGHEIDNSYVAVIPLDADFRRKMKSELPVEKLKLLDLEPEGFVLVVSTIESRKGHIHAFDAWAQLVEEYGADRIPTLVCVGNRGWLNDEVYGRLDSDPSLAQKVLMLSGLSDGELALLYRTCLFTLYPSLYEGWGLPVTESLCYGKVPLISDAASLPEAGGALAVYAEAGSASQIKQQAEKLIFDRAYLETLSAKISREFSPRTWEDLSEQIIGELERFASRTGDLSEANRDEDVSPNAQIGRWHSLVRNKSTRIWPGMGMGERYRRDLGWYWPEDRGSRVRGATGTLAFRLDQPHEPIRILLNMVGDEYDRCHYVIDCDGQNHEGQIEPNTSRWEWLDLPASDTAHDIRIDFHSLKDKAGNRPTFFVRGFHIFERNDHKARREFSEAVILDRLDVLDIFREQDRVLSAN